MSQLHRKFLKRNLQSVAYPVLALLSLVVIGSLGFYWLEGMSPLDAVYMTVITLSTVGFGEITPLSPAGRLFAMFLIISGAGLVAYTLTAGVDFIFSQDWQEYLKTRRRQKMLDSLTNHVIVCGFGRVGRYVAHELGDEGLTFVVIDPLEEQIDHATAAGYLGFKGNAANEHYLEQAGIRRARALVAAANSDAENVFITLTARSLNPNLFIIARANYEDSEPKLRRAGADHVVLPYRMGGRRMVSLIVRPDAAIFLDEVSRKGGVELIVEQMSISSRSRLAGRTLAGLELGKKFGVTVLGCMMPNGELFTNPKASTRIESGMVLIVIGTPEQIQQLNQMAEGSP